MKNKPSQDFIKEVQKKYKSPLKVEDILNKTDYFDKVEEQSEELQFIEEQSNLLSKQKKSLFKSRLAILTLSVLFLSLVITQIVILTQYDRLLLSNKDPEQTILTEEVKEFMYEYCDFICEKVVFSLSIDEQVVVHIYKGKKQKLDNIYAYHYFFVVDGYNNFNNNFKIVLNNQELYPEINKNYGYLTSTENTDIELDFVVHYLDFAKHFRVED